ncbi:single-stranded-DNA-specific exonuclease RecJ [Roseburia sp. BX1005]|uniref:Single-stranded-DNA-specific exonuclease RecJ n=1 Tax=Roseburia zhanii TaxID=2763064 RepID=A0A923LS35_9FIRM|nr:single-stranded-DNA-specific exonuclease RecJ [Roseburia zhanii]MBC5714856.1 single-stranded-DNA-specific exonuclease RecJ [Roseburia zhanii]
MSIQKEKWYVQSKKADFKAVGEKYGIDQVTARIIRNRDIIEDADIAKYLHPDLSDLYSPHLMKDMDRLIEILHKKITEKKSIRIIGDYDIDGIESSYILLKGLQRVGAIVSVAIPDRMKDGYGVNESLITKAKEDGIDTIITCDNGIAALDAIAYAKEEGLTVLVTDHHDIPYQEEDGVRSYLRSQADAIVNPKQKECGYPFAGICGAVVAWKVIQALYEACKIPAEEAMVFLENAAFATVGDVMDLIDENRIIVKYGLEQMRHTRNLGLQALIQQKEVQADRLSAYHLGFVLGPCINASGRLDTAVRSLKLLLADQKESAIILATELADLNEERKQMTADGLDAAVEMIQAQALDQQKVMVVYLKDLHESLAGIVAGRIRELYHHPVFVLTKAEDGVKGSGRSIETYSMYEELCKCQDLFTKFGGHKMAAGLSIPEEKVQEFTERINANATLTEDDFIPKILIDVPMPLAYVNRQLVEELKVLEPFGKGNAKPVFADKNIRIRDKRIVGKNRNVLKLTIQDMAGGTYPAVYFGDAETMMQFLETKDVISIVYYPEINSYMGREEIQFVISNYC